MKLFLRFLSFVSLLLMIIFAVTGISQLSFEMTIEEAKEHYFRGFYLVSLFAILSAIFAGFSILKDE